jgi:flagellar biosynthetic protein FliP
VRTAPQQRRINSRGRRHKAVIRFGVLAILLIGLAMPAGIAWGQTPAPLISIGLDQEAEEGKVAVVMQLFLLMTVLSLAPSILIMLTSFTRIAIVFSLLRQAMGTNQLPPNQVVIGLSLF